MVNFNILGGLVWFLNFILFLVLQKTPNIGRARGGGISGWAASLLGVYLLYSKQISFFSQIKTTGMWIIAVLIVAAIITIYTSALQDKPANQFVVIVTRIGYGIGIVIGALCAFLIP
jgi:hypothetical protein